MKKLFTLIIALFALSSMAVAQNIVNWTANVNYNGMVTDMPLEVGGSDNAGSCSVLKLNSMTIALDAPATSVQVKVCVYKVTNYAGYDGFYTLPLSSADGGTTWTVDINADLVDETMGSTPRYFEVWPIINGTELQSFKLQYVKVDAGAAIYEIHRVSFAMAYDDDDHLTEGIQFKELPAYGWSEQTVNVSGRVLRDLSLRDVIIITSVGDINNVAFRYNVHKTSEAAGTFITINAIQNGADEWKNDNSDVVEGILDGLDAGTDYYFEFYASANDGDIKFNNGGEKYKILFTTPAASTVQGVSEAVINKNAPKYSATGARVGDGYKGIVIQGGKKIVVE